MIMIKHITRLFSPLLCIAVILSIFTYMWNPLGYPGFVYDDGTYIGRAMHVLVTRSPQEGTLHDHPYFGQIFLAGMLWLTGFPNSVAPSADSDIGTYVKMLWLVPKVLIGFFAVIDTLLIYKIAERRYNNKMVAFIASILFAVMPMWWSLRDLFLESLLLPLLLSSILFATYTKYPKDCGEGKKKENMSLIIISGVLMGLAIFTKIPVFAFIPLVAYVIFTNSNRSFKTLGLWFIPVVIIPLIWPLYAVIDNQFDWWWNGIYWQTHRQNEGLRNVVIENFSHTPIFSWLGFAGLIFAIIKRDYFVILWAIPFLIFLYFIGFVRDFHLIPLLPALCVSTSRLIVGLSSYIPYQKVRQTLPFSIISAITIFGLINIAPQLATNVNDNTLALSAFVTRYLEDNRNDNITVISNHVYSWIPKYVFGLRNNDYTIPEDVMWIPPKNEKVMLVVDDSIRLIKSQNDTMGESLRRVYNLYDTNETMKIDVGPHRVILPKG